MKVELIAYTPNPENIIEEAGRTCYQSKTGDPTIIQRWINAGHESIIEHASATFRVSGVSRALTHQLVRHRIGFSYSQQSQRYVSEKVFEYVIPGSIKENANPLMLQRYKDLMSSIQQYYNFAISEGIKKEDARFVLPNACCTEIVVTMNFRAARNFLKLRMDKHSQWEIRELANIIFDYLYEIAPNVFEDLKILKGE